jgi:hypothetical protein
MNRKRDLKQQKQQKQQNNSTNKDKNGINEQRF